MQTAADIMTKDVITVRTDLGVVEAAQLLLDKGINGAPVVDDDGRVVGILCQSDLVAQQKRISLPSIFSFLDGFIPLNSIRDLEHEVEKMSAATVGQAMTAKVTSVKSDTNLEEVATLMVERSFHTIPVIDGGKLVGIIGKSDVLKTVIG